ncbi:MAG: hypothetical protein U0821_27590 [Chloroflexota bacterium]
MNALVSPRASRRLALAGVLATALLFCLATTVAAQSGEAWLDALAPDGWVSQRGQALPGQLGRVLIAPAAGTGTPIFVAAYANPGDRVARAWAGVNQAVAPLNCALAVRTGPRGELACTDPATAQPVVLFPVPGAIAAVQYPPEVDPTSLDQILARLAAYQPVEQPAGPPAVVTESGIEGLALARSAAAGLGSAEERPVQATLAVLDVTQTPVAQVTTNERGRFKVLLPPGDYVLAPLAGQPFAAARSQPISVVAGELTQVILGFDSGLR